MCVCICKIIAAVAGENFNIATHTHILVSAHVQERENLEGQSLRPNVGSLGKQWTNNEEYAKKK